MRKIGIVTLFGYHNYGNRLQMYAVQKVYEDLGLESEIIKYKLEEPKDPFVIHVKVIIRYILFLRTNLYRYFLQSKRIFSFQKHAKKHYKESKNFINPLSIDGDFHESYSFFSVGSDQIWGWFIHPIAEFVFLKFAPKEKRIAFAPSFGSATIDEKYRDLFTEGLKGFNKISVREESGAHIVKHFSGQDATVLCDPTMCLSREEWLQFSTVHKRKPRKKYVLTYFLGEPSPKACAVLKQIADEYEIVHLNSLEHSKFYAVNPSEWVDYIDSASLFLTDSFHGVVFSLVMQTPFAVYSRAGGENMHTRISNILAKFEMEDRFEIDSKDSSLFRMDFSNTEDIVSTEKAYVYAFLEKSLHL